MNEPIAFARTLRALDADDFRISNIALFLAVALLACWTVWLFGARVPQYETVQDARLQTADLVVADFPLGARERIRLHQPALVDIGGVSVRAEVASVDTGSGRLQVGLKLLSRSERETASRATVHIEVERISPALFVLRAIGRANR